MYAILIITAVLACVFKIIEKTLQRNYEMEKSEDPRAISFFKTMWWLAVVGIFLELIITVVSTFGTNGVSAISNSSYMEQTTTTSTPTPSPTPLQETPSPTNSLGSSSTGSVNSGEFTPEFDLGNNTDNRDEWATNGWFTGEILSPEEPQQYRLTTDVPGRIEIDTYSYEEYGLAIKFTAKDAEAPNFEFDTSHGRISDSKKDSESFDVEAGTYYLTVSGDSGAQYGFRCRFIEAKTTESEPNNSLENACKMQMENESSGFISETDEYDYYKFTMDEIGELDLDVKSFINNFALDILDSEGQEVGVGVSYFGGNFEEPKIKSIKAELGAGNYYIRIKKQSKGTGKYTLTPHIIPFGVTHIEPNDTEEQAVKINFNEDIVGAITISSPYDYYTFTTSSPSELSLSCTAHLNNLWISIIDSKSNKEIKTIDGYMGGNLNDGKTKEYSEIELQPGTYYLFCKQLGSYGKYSIRLSTQTS